MVGCCASLCEQDPPAIRRMCAWVVVVLNLTAWAITGYYLFSLLTFYLLEKCAHATPLV
jgi:hypothetical protein